MNRRGFLGAMLAAGAAPAIVKAENLMKIFVPPKKKIITFTTFDFVCDPSIQNFDSKLDLDLETFRHIEFVEYSEAMQRRLYRNATPGARMSRPTNIPTTMDALFQQMKQDRYIIKEYRKQQFNL